ncbi:ABC transporter substrate-binding protein [Bombiscardovia nodaiensis]|uniref:ABC transporter substrate-binding protein n=1 Tax=Bombiscardovia nodaiensis TaxID=2932181 RepID=A0ABM8B702_9BIFI|nr:ABC transporter substrate-binding protein [Bombiscardovia nodaiensis]
MTQLSKRTREKSLVSKVSRVPALLVLTVLVLLFSLSGCGQAASANNPSTGGQFQVVSSIGQWSALAQELGGKTVNTQAVINNPNVDAHDYEPTSSDIGLIARADLVIVNGADYDTWASKAAADNGKQVVNIAQRSGHRSGDNPHLWFSAQARLQAGKAISHSYQKARPEHKDDFVRMYDLWQAKEKQLGDQLQQGSQQMQGMTFAATESAADYLAADLHLKNVTPRAFAQAVANEGEPSPADVHEFEQALATHRAQVLVFNEQEESAVSRQLLAAAKRAGVPVVEVSEQMPTKYTNLTDWIAALYQSFAQAAHVAQAAQ